MSIVLAHDAIHDNISHLPPGQAAGYTTGTPDIRWTSADWQAHPGAVRIDQDFAASDPAADVLDVERGAATFADCPVWARKAQADFTAVVRKGQRRPAIYMSASNVSSVTTALIHGGFRSGVHLWVANWNLSESQAIQDVKNAAGPFPIIGIQFADPGPYDNDIFAVAWLNDVSGGPVPPAPPPVLRPGATGTWVHLAQTDLNRHGAHPLLVTDGVFGPKTEAAVIEFQKKSGLVPDGIIGPKTWKALAA
jgi:Putative peptidoglycan binding domain